MSTSTATSQTLPGTIELTQSLVRFESVNPPGGEGQCIQFLEEVLNEAGIETTVVGAIEERPNLVARVRGRGQAPAFLMHGHVDVVPTDGQIWKHPPFAGEIIDGVLWGRGTLDMKGGVAMMVSALLRIQDAGLAPAGDIVFAAFSDQECGSGVGAKYVIEHHPALLEGVRYSIGEFGGFSFNSSGRRFYPIGVSEKRWCTLKLRTHGHGGHASVPVRGGAMAELGSVLKRLDRRRLPVHVTPLARQVLAGFGARLPLPARLILQGLARPRLTDFLLDRVGDELWLFDVMLHNTVSPATVDGARRSDAIPETVELELDGRVLPGLDPEVLVAEVRALCGDAIEVELIDVHEGAPADPDMGLFEPLGEAIRGLDPEAIPVPLLLPGTTDGRLLAQLGIQNYGYLPMRFPEDFDPSELIHGPNERIPVDALEFGAEVIERLLRRL
ncbi:MAG: M20/M25/M40 family metallo-hydrolase [Solirubrobacterales bacterium]